jgi:ADP-glucose pyrophosphorylase
VARAAHATGMRVRTLPQYIHALRDLTTGVFHETTNPYAEEWTPTFRLVDPAARVDSSAIVHDSVVMNGASVGARAAIVRSVVCPGAVIKPGEKIFDSVVPAREAGGRT